MAQIGLFSSFAFLVFSMSFSFIFPRQIWKGLLLGSLITLGLFMPFTLLVLLLASSITYYIGIWSHSNQLWRVLGIGGLLLLLIIYKLKDSWGAFSHVSNSNEFEQIETWQIPGLSFFVFNAVSYLVDIKRKYINPENSYLKLLLYLLYFPTLFSGPLHRYKYLNDQFNQAKLTEESFTNGLRLILWGLFKNIVLANRLNQLLISLKQSDIAGWWTLLIGFVFFFYIYFSFSSFVDFIQGVSEIFNVQLKDNFHPRVYFSKNRHEFWSGWHITLNEWFRDYFFYWQIKYSIWRNKPYALLFLAFILIGLWHGFTLSYFIWGLLSGIWIITEKVFDIPKIMDEANGNFVKLLGITYHIFLCSVIALFFIYTALGDLIDKIQLTAYFPWEIWLLHKRNILIIIAMFIQLDLFHAKSKGKRINYFLGNLPAWQRNLIYIEIICCIIIFGFFSEGIENYYIQF